MAKSPDCPRCKKQLVIPDAPTWREFLDQAARIWQAAHPRPKKAKRTRGRPPELVEFANDLVLKEVTKVTARAGVSRKSAIDRWASSLEIVENLTKTLELKLAEQDSHHERFTVRRAIKLALGDLKSLSAITDGDLNLLRQRRPTSARNLEHLMRDLASVVQLAINARDNPTNQEASLAAIREMTRLTARMQQAKRAPI